MSFMNSTKKRKRDFMNNNNNIKFNSISLEKRIQESINEIKENNIFLNNRHFNHSPTSAFIDVAQSKGRKSRFLENGDYIVNNKNKF